MIWLNPQDRLKHERALKEAKGGDQESTNTRDVNPEYTVKELKAMCKDKGLKGYSKLKEQELLDLLGL